MAAASHKVNINYIILRASGFFHDFWQKRNPGPSGNDDLDASGLLAAQIEDKDKDEDEEPHDENIIDDQVGFFTHHNKSNHIDIFFVLEGYE